LIGRYRYRDRDAVLDRPIIDSDPEIDKLRGCVNPQG
jgi:hypothetical protein